MRRHNAWQSEGQTQDEGCRRARCDDLVITVAADAIDTVELKASERWVS